ncbi:MULTISPECIES: AEC family transporter [Roseateles]|uniref:AEC family transporter n=1 Tax=Pelomonas caseinilytica TaxID=2906763 RepID=A0ABS8XGF6_9BURK|nr:MULTISPECIES: AEC family transporter [unclassified Roseateles]MCE4538823.1 AEC family transporter [Pelomonas sp. P7]HEV6965508.1 AEC family transporter [Roseateles sp.]
MTWPIAFKLLAILVAVTIGYVVGRMRWLGHAQAGSDGDPARVLANAAFYIFVPALLFRTTARLDTSTLPWAFLFAFFVPVLAVVALIYAFERWRRKPGEAVTAPSVKAITAGFGNTLQVGVPVAAGVFGERGLALHIAVVSLHALTLLSLLTSLVELDLARDRHSRTFGATLRQTVRNTVIHPVVLPVLAGLAWHLTGWPLPAVLDEVLQSLGTAVVPLCLTLIGMSLAYYGWPKSWHGLSGLVSAKLLLIPAVVFGIGHWVLGLKGLPLAVIVMTAALPTGSNALIFAQRYRTMEAEVTAATVLSTVLYVATAPLWLALLAWVSPW